MSQKRLKEARRGSKTLGGPQSDLKDLKDTQRTSETLKRLSENLKEPRRKAKKGLEEFPLNFQLFRESSQNILEYTLLVYFQIFQNFKTSL